MKVTPQTMEEVVPTIFDTLHLLLSLGRWTINLLTRLNAGLFTWSITADLKVNELNNRIEASSNKLLSSRVIYSSRILNVLAASVLLFYFLPLYETCFYALIVTL